MSTGTIQSLGEIPDIYEYMGSMMESDSEGEEDCRTRSVGTGRGDGVSEAGGNGKDNGSDGMGREVLMQGKR